MSDEPVANYLLLMDPEWEPEGGRREPPIEAVVGLWPVRDDGSIGRFRSNPEYFPRTPGSPTDPVDALLRLVAREEAEIEQVQLVLRDSLVDVAMNGDGRPLIVHSPDDVPCVVVVTAAEHQSRVGAPMWQRVELDELVLMLADGIDVFLNPYGPAPVRLTGDFMRETMLLSDDEVAEATARFRPGEAVAVIPWEVGLR